MTTTVILTSQSIGTGSNVGEELTFATTGMKVTKQAATTAFVISAKLTNGAASYSLSTRPLIRYASSPFDLTYTAAPAIFRNGGSRYLEMVPAVGAGVIVSKSSEIETVCGNYIYIWCYIPTTSVAQLLDLSILELP